MGQTLLDIQITDRWHEAFPGAHVGVMLISTVERSRATALEAHKRRLEASLREQYAGESRADLLEHEVLQAYGHYYKRFGHTYHVLLQLESVLGGKTLPRVSPLVDANFAAELETFILSAGHDADRLAFPLTLEVSQVGETSTQLGGKNRVLRSGDTMLRDIESVVCTVLSGQDARTAITPGTRRALYVAYAPAGISAEAVKKHLETIRRNVRLAVPDAHTEGLVIYSAKGSNRD
jgi:DNA/RNA-binding domain of Phe-tRNA-synthetase-like protein